MNNTTKTYTWTDVLATEKNQPYFIKAIQHVNQARKSGKTIYPEKKHTFNALTMTPLETVSVVIIGQDPYHGPNQAHGLCFSVQKGITPPPSLKNIFKELKRDCNINIPKHGCLESWARQGVLLLNTVLTVERGQAHSHADIGWGFFTDQVIKTVNKHCSGVIFLLWGSHAQKKAQWVDQDKHHILKSTHPSPLSAHRGFLGCSHFSQTNKILQQQNKNIINWDISTES